MKKMPTDLCLNYPCNPPALEPMIDQLLALRNGVVQKEAAYKGLANV